MTIALDDSPRALLTDLYQLTMAAAYDDAGIETTATFELFVREMPARRSYLVAAGLEQALDYLATLRFRPEEIEYLRGLAVFEDVKPRFFERLARLRFTGEVWAAPEGTPFFAGEPILRVTAPILEAQIVETYLLSTVNFQSAVATKAARIVGTASGRPVVDFGTRRAHGPEAAVLAARAAYIGGCIGTSNVYAGRRLGLPVYGTQAHSFVLAFDREEESFAAFHRTFPRTTILLIDTFDTLEGARRAAAIGPDLAGVRIDSGDLAALSKDVRGILDRAGLDRARIFASGDLNEYRIEELLAAGARIDVFGVGTDLVTSRDEPALGGVYKLVEEERGEEVRRVAKLSQAKTSYPGKKQVWRLTDGQGRFAGDVIARDGEPPPAAGAEPLLTCVMREGRILGPHPPLEGVRMRAAGCVERLPEVCRRISGAEPFPVRRSRDLERLRAEVETLARGVKQ